QLVSFWSSHNQRANVVQIYDKQVAVRHDDILLIWRDEQMVAGWNAHNPAAVQFYGKPFERHGVTKVFDFSDLHSATFHFMTEGNSTALSEVLKSLTAKG